MALPAFRVQGLQAVMNGSAGFLGYSSGAFIVGKVAAIHPGRVLSVVYAGKRPSSRRRRRNRPVPRKSRSLPGGGRGQRVGGLHHRGDTARQAEADRTHSRGGRGRPEIGSRK